MSTNHLLAIGAYEANRITPAHTREPLLALLASSKTNGIHRICDNNHAKVFYSLANKAVFFDIVNLKLKPETDTHDLYTDGKNWIIDARTPLTMVCWYASNEEFKEALQHRKMRLLGGSEFDAIYQHLLNQLENA